MHTRLPIQAETAETSDDLVAMLVGAEHDPTLAAALATDLTSFMTAVAAVLPPEPDGLRHIAAAGEWDRVAATAASGLRARLVLRRKPAGFYELGPESTLHHMCRKLPCGSGVCDLGIA